MKLKLLTLLLFAGLFVGPGTGMASQQSEFELGRKCYTDGQFKAAANHFKLALRANPDDAPANYWLGRSYEVLADISTPFGHRYNGQARTYLTKAVELAPDRRDFRNELVRFLMDSGSGDAMAQAAVLLHANPGEPDSEYMLQRLDDSRKANSSIQARLVRIFLAAERGIYEIGATPLSAFTSSDQPAAIAKPAK